MKKGLILIAALLLFGMAANAAVSVEAGGEVNVVFTYEDPNAGFVGLVGDFQGWNLDGAIPMEKDENGVWTVSLPAKVSDTLKYKFNVDGEWTEDSTAPLTADDGFGGLNGVVNVAAVMSGAGDEVAGGLIGGLFLATWADTSFITENPYDTTQKGFSASDVTFNAKAYFKASGYLMPDLLYVASEFKLFDGAVAAYKKNGVNESAFDVEFADAYGDFLTLPWQAYQSFGMNWSATNGKFRSVLELHALNTQISHAVGWSKTGEQDLGEFFFEHWSDPDANSGVTEITPIEAFDFSGVELDYLVNFDASDSKILKNNIIAMVTAGDIFVEAVAHLDTNTTDVTMYADDLDSRYTLGVSYSTDNLTVEAQGAYRVYENLTDPYFAGLAVEVTDIAYLLDVEASATYAGPDVETGLFDGDDDVDGLFDSSVKVTANITPDELSVYVENTFSANYKEFDGMSEKVELGASIDAGVAVIDPSIKLVIPTDGVDFQVEKVEVTADAEAWDTTVRWSPSSDFATNDVILTALYDLGNDMGLALGAGLKLDEDDTNNTFGATLGFNWMTTWEAVKKPYLFATMDYNMNAMDGNDNYQLKDFDDIEIGTGASVRLGLRWDF